MCTGIKLSVCKVVHMQIYLTILTPKQCKTQVRPSIKIRRHVPQKYLHKMYTE